MGMHNRNIIDGTLRAYKLSNNYRQGKYSFIKISGQPMVFRMASSIPALPTASQGQVNFVHGGPGRNHWYAEMYQTTAQTLMPEYDLSGNLGLEIALDQVDNESVEYVIGGNNSRNPFAMTVGTDPDFGFRARFNIPDASGSDQFLVGWRKVQAFQVPTSFLTTGDAGYTDFAAMGFAGTKADPNPVRIATDLNDSGSTTVTAVNFTWADNKTHELEVRVIGAKAYYFINGVQLGQGLSIALDADGGAITSQTPTAPASFTFDTGDILVPFIFCRQDTDLTPIYLREFEVGHLVERGLDKNAE